MRIWDIHPGYMNKYSQSGEHRELTGCYNIITGQSKTNGYSNHPETKRWYGKHYSLKLRHDLLVKEMSGSKIHNTPINCEDNGIIQDERLLSDYEQVDLLLSKYISKRQAFGRLNLYDYPGYKDWMFKNSTCWQQFR